MALNIGKKIFRNLPEQVGYDKERIDEILDYLNSSEFEKNIIKISSVTGTFTPEEMEILNRDIAFITRSAGNVYVKSYIETGYIYFDAIKIDGSGYDDQDWSVYQDAIKVDPETGDYEIVNKKLCKTWGPDKIQSRLDEKADLEGANFTGPVTATTLKQTTPNAYIDIDSAVVSLPAGIDFSITYGKFEEINNIAYLVLIFNFANNTESSIAIGNANTIEFSIPEGIADKIVDKNGVKLSLAGVGNAGVSADVGFGDNGVNIFLNNRTIILGRNGTGTKNKLVLQIRDCPSVAAGVTHKYVFRTFFTLI